MICSLAPLLSPSCLCGLTTPSLPSAQVPKAQAHGTPTSAVGGTAAPVSE